MSVPPIHGVSGVEARIRANQVINEGEAQEGTTEWLPTLFTVHMMSLRGSKEDWFGVRFWDDGWLPTRFKTEEEARAARDEVLLKWLNEEDVVLVLGFSETMEE